MNDQNLRLVLYSIDSSVTVFCVYWVSARWAIKFVKAQKKIYEKNFRRQKSLLTDIINANDLSHLKKRIKKRRRMNKRKENNYKNNNNNNNNMKESEEERSIDNSLGSMYDDEPSHYSKYDDDEYSVQKLNDEVKEYENKLRNALTLYRVLQYEVTFKAFAQHLARYV